MWVCICFIIYKFAANWYAYLLFWTGLMFYLKIFNAKIRSKNMNAFFVCCNAASFNVLCSLFFSLFSFLSVLYFFDLKILLKSNFFQLFSPFTTEICIRRAAIPCNSKLYQSCMQNFVYKYNNPTWELNCLFKNNININDLFDFFSASIALTSFLMIRLWNYRKRERREIRDLILIRLLMN